jgi:hypothetical protein
MPVVAPSTDVYGAAIDARIAVLQALVNANTNKAVEYQLQQELNSLQMQAVDHYMVTGWLAAYVILAAYTPSSRDATGQTLLTRVNFLRNLYNNAPAPPPGNSEGYGGSGWVTVAQNYAIALYAAQITLVEYLMTSTVFGTSAATMLANLTGFQSFPFEYVFDSAGYTDAWSDD